MACLGSHYAFSALLDPLIRALRPIVKRPEQFIPRHFQRPIIAFKIPMMHLMMKGAKFQPVLVFHNQTFKPCMRSGSGQCIILQVIQDMNWMSGNHPMDQHGAQVNDMLNRMHRQPRPWANVYISMMQRFHHNLEIPPNLYPKLCFYTSNR